MPVTRGALRRRTLLRRGLLALSALALGGVAASCTGPQLSVTTPQPTRRVYKVVFLFTRLTEPVVQSNIAMTKQSLLELGWVDQQTIVFDERGANGNTENFAALAVEVIDLHPDVIVCQNVVAVRALMKATTTIPIVFAAINADPLESGVVKSLARPGGNVTGIGISGSQLSAKRLQLLKELAPKTSRVAVIEDQAAVPHSMNALRDAAPNFGVEILPIYIRSVDDLDSALASAVAVGADALLHLAGFVTGTQTNGAKIADFAIAHGWPSVGVRADFGGLLNYDGVLVAPWTRDRQAPRSPSICARQASWDSACHKRSCHKRHRSCRARRPNRRPAT
jgi:putative ABC transport system substrate-binding protein